MAISTPKLVTITAILIGALAITSFVLVNSFIPQYSVTELFEENNPNDFIGKNVTKIFSMYPRPR